MQCNEFATFLEQQGISPLSPAAQDHLAECSACQDFFADLSSIVVVAKELPAEAEPPGRIWIALRAQLEAEGLIKEPAFASPQPSSGWLQDLQAMFRPRVLATAGVGLALAIAAFLQLHKPNTTAIPLEPVAKQHLQPTSSQSAVQQQISPQIQAKAQTPTPQASAKHALATPRLDEPLVAPPSMEVFQAETAGTNLGETEVSDSRLAGNPALDESLRKNLRILNEFIAECEAHLKKHPHDTLAREYLNGAYQQKAQLIGVMLDSGRSEQ